ncbi:MAG: PD40 domain-containing protein [Anaerolineae bacterium]|nr:PD40 domain-containing protein [Anaerolineae bacterium]
MQRNQMKAHIFFTAVILVLSIGVWLVGCTPDEEVVVVTVRPTSVGEVGTAVSTVIPAISQEANTLIPGPILSNPMPPLPGMLYWGPDGKETWLVDNNGQLQKLSEFQILPKFVANSSKFIYFKDGDLWEADQNDGEQQLLFAFSELGDWHYWSAETGVIWILDPTGIDLETAQKGILKVIDTAGNILNLSEGFLLHSPAIAPDGKMVAFDEEETPVLYHLENGKQQFNLIDYGLSSELDFYAPVWAPDGQLLAWATHAPSLDTYSLVVFNLGTDSAMVVQLDAHPDWTIEEIHWQPVGDKLVIMRRGGDPYAPEFDGWIIDLQTQERLPVGPIAEAWWSPNGDWLAYSMHAQEGEPYSSIWVVTADGRERYHLGYGEDLIWSPDSRFLVYCGLEETGLEGFGRWLSTSENGWMSLPIDFGYPEGCITMQWLKTDRPETIAYVLPQFQPSTISTATPVLTVILPTVTAVCTLYPPGTAWPQVALPAECYNVLADFEEQQYCACSNFEFSPDGKWFAFTMGDYMSGYSVRPGLINLETGEVQTNTVGTGLMRFLPNNERLVYNSWGEGGDIWWANSLTGESLRLGPGGNVSWNADETAFVVEATPYVGMASAVWGYNVETHTLFLPERWFADNKPVWVPDGTHLLYQHQTNIATAENMVIFSPRQIYLVDAVSGEEQVVLSDPAYHYHLCPDDRTESCYWNGDWVKVQRLPYHPAMFDFEDYNNSDYRCAWYVKDCTDQPEYLGLNWRTLEVLPWSEIVN